MTGNTDNLKNLATCASTAIKDIRAYRDRTGITKRVSGFGGIANDPAIPWLKHLHEGITQNAWLSDGLKTTACYALDNLNDAKSWTATKALGVKKEQNPEAFVTKDTGIKSCKKLIKDACDGKIE